MRIPTRNKQRQSGFSLIEVIVFIFILNLVLVAAVSYLIMYTYQMRIIEHKTYATFYTEELKEWLDSERETNWAALYNKSPSSGIEYCANTAITLNKSVSTLPAGVCNFNGVDGSGPQIFKRTVLLWSTSTTRINAKIIVAWNEIDTKGNVVPFSQTVDIAYSQY